MKDRITLSKAVAISEDLAAMSFRPNYIYLFDEAVMVYFDPSIIPAMRIAYPSGNEKDNASQIVMPKDVAENFKAALAAVLDLCRERMENPFVEVEENPIDFEPGPTPKPAEVPATAPAAPAEGAPAAAVVTKNQEKAVK